MSVVTQTQRIIIREYLPNELEKYLKHFFDERVALYVPKRSREERITIFKNALEHYKTTKKHGMWGMFDKANGEFIGGCLLRTYNDEPHTYEIGYSLEHQYWGHGLATEMVTALVTYGFTNTDIKQLIAVTTMPNIASQRVLEKNGFIREDNVIKDGEELAFFRLLR